MNSLSSRNDLEIIFKTKLNSALGWADSKERSKRGERELLNAAQSGVSRSFFKKKQLVYWSSELPLKASENRLSSRNFPAFLLPSVEPERKSDRAEQRPQGTGA